MNLSNLLHALEWYKKKLFHYIDVPYLVDPSINKITFPDCNQMLEDYPLSLIGSGEQGFLSLLKKKCLEEGLYYITVTPCFRLSDDDPSKFLYPTFQKVELGAWDYEPSCAEDYARDFATQALQYFKESWGHLANFYLDTSDPNTLYDIYMQVGENKVEVGSYGIRKINSTFDFEDIYWAYGTGLAEPRFSRFLESYTEKSYHDQFIPKGKIGEMSKVVEEIAEYEEAENEILKACELADIQGALRAVMEKSKFTFADYDDMATMTTRAFKIGKRK